MEENILLKKRKKLQYTQKTVALKCNINIREYQRFESGERDIVNAKGITLLNICHVLNINPFELLNESNKG